MHERSRPTLAALLALTLAGAAATPAPAIHAASTTITVTSVADLVADDGVCTLPEAVTAANSGTAKKANDPLFKLAAQLLAAQLNYFAGAAQNDATTSNIQRAVMLLGAYAFDGLSYSPGLSTGDARTATCLATQLDNYNNGAVTTCP